MKSIGNIFNKVGAIDEIKQRQNREEALIDEIINSKKMQDFIKNSEDTVTRQMIVDDLINAKFFVEQKTKCEVDEKGNCISHPEGLVNNLEVRNNRLHLYYTRCPVREKQLDYEEKESLIKSFHISKDIKNASFDDLYHDSSSTRNDVIKKSIDAAISIVSGDEPKGLYIHGQFGVGKSFILGCIANELKEKTVSTMMIYMPELLTDLKSGFKDGSTEEKLLAIKTAEVLMLDDLGAEDITVWSRDEVLTPILQSRMSRDLPTFISSNYSVNDLIELYSHTKNGAEDKIKSSRMVERIRALTDEVELTGLNYRHKQ